ncbi:hypothetical protein GGI04_004207 [Coemansia thaxteri]|nr:hypothetical protein GGI04_004207 [Coemansia thaxteri]
MDVRTEGREAQFASGLQDLLQKLALASDTETIKTVTATLNQQFYCNAACVPALLTISKDHDQWQIRQLAAVELRKRISLLWDEIDGNTQEQMRQAILKAIVEETNDLARHGLARVISTIAKSDIPNRKWDGLIQFLYTCCQSPTATHREIGVYVLDSLFETIADTMGAHLQTLFELFTVLINDPESLTVQVTTLEALGKVAEFIEPEDRAGVATFQGLVPSMVHVLQKCLATGNEDSASRCFEVLNALILVEAPLLNRHFGELVEFSISVGSNEELEESLRIMALNFLVWTTT